MSFDIRDYASREAQWVAALRFIAARGGDAA
jgi:hypothetical protein